MDTSTFVLAVIACFGSSTVIVTYILFSELRMLRYIELVFYISVNDLIASIGVATASSNGTSAACIFQSFVVNFNYMSSMMWSTVISYQVWLVVCKNLVLKKMLFFHILCWGFPLLTSFLPLSTNDYGIDDATNSWCFLRNSPRSPSWGLLLWTLLSFYVWFWIGLLINAGFVIHILYRLRQVSMDRGVILLTVQKLIFYPAVTFLCWGLLSVTSMYAVTNTGYLPKLSDSAIKLAVMQGMFNPLFFFYFNYTVRYRWYLYLRDIYHFVIQKDQILLSHESNSNLSFMESLKTEVDYCPSETTFSSQSMFCSMFGTAIPSQHTFGGRESTTSNAYIVESTLTNQGISLHLINALKVKTTNRTRDDINDRPSDNYDNDSNTSFENRDTLESQA